MHLAAGLFGKTVDHGEAKAGAHADRLGGEEWVEGTGNDLRAHAVSGIGDEDAGIGAGLNIARAGLSGVELEVFG